MNTMPTNWKKKYEQQLQHRRRNEILSADENARLREQLAQAMAAKGQFETWLTEARQELDRTKAMLAAKSDLLERANAMLREREIQLAALHNLAAALGALATKPK